MKYFYSTGAVLAVGAALFAWAQFDRPVLEVAVWLVLAGVLAVAAEVAEFGEKIAARAAAADPSSRMAKVELKGAIDPLTGQKS